eukprot:4810143-Pyramimonas_sp.AAC.1
MSCAKQARPPCARHLRAQSCKDVSGCVVQPKKTKAQILPKPSENNRFGPPGALWGAMLDGSRNLYHVLRRHGSKVGTIPCAETAP